MSDRLSGVFYATGSEALDMAEIVGRQGLVFRSIDIEVYRTRLAAKGAPEWLVLALGSMFESVAQGRFAGVFPVHDL